MTSGRGLAITALLAVLLQPACGQEPLPPIRIGTFPGPSSELLFLAQHRGWLAPADFRLVEFINDGEVMRAFRNGRIEAAVMTVDEVLLVAQGGMAPIMLLVAAESRGADAVLAHGDVTSLADLKGRRVAVQVNSASAYLLRRALKTGGVDVSDIEVVNVPPDRHRSAFLDREFDAVVTAEPVRSQIVSDGGVDLFNSVSIPLELLGVIIVHSDYLARYGERASAICSAWRLAENDIRTPPAREWVAARMKVTPGALAEMLAVVRLVTPAESHALLAAPSPQLLPTAARIQTTLIESGLLTSPIDLDRLFRWPAGVDQAACRG
jgi:NitT/TauT family transport system substrate-binding protein